MVEVLLSQNIRTLETLSLGWNPSWWSVNEDFEPALLQLIAQQSSLKTLQLKGNQLSESSKLNFEQAAKAAGCYIDI